MKNVRKHRTVAIFRLFLIAPSARGPIPFHIKCFRKSRDLVSPNLNLQLDAMNNFAVSLFVCGHRPKTKELLEFFKFLFLFWFISSFKIKLSEKNIALPGNLTGTLLLHSQALYQLSYRNFNTNCWKIIYLT